MCNKNGSLLRPIVVPRLCPAPRNHRLPHLVVGAQSRIGLRVTIIGDLLSFTVGGVITNNGLNTVGKYAPVVGGVDNLPPLATVAPADVASEFRVTATRTGPNSFTFQIRDDYSCIP